MTNHKLKITNTLEHIDLHCLGSWTTNGIVRFLLSDDDQQRYSAWYYTYPQTIVDDINVAQALPANQIVSLRQQQQLQQPSPSNLQLAATAAATAGSQQVIDLNIALIRPPHLPEARKMQIKLTKQQQCGSANSPQFQEAAQSYQQQSSSFNISQSASSNDSNFASLAINTALGCCLLIVILLLFCAIKTNFVNSKNNASRHHHNHHHQQQHIQHNHQQQQSQYSQQYHPTLLPHHQHLTIQHHIQEHISPSQLH